MLAEICPPSGGETNGNDEPWVPGHDITLDEAKGEYVIDRLAIDELKRNPDVLFSDTSTLEPLEAGYFVVTTSGPLSEALGWQRGDVLLDANGHDLADAEAFADAYPELTQSQTIDLMVDRDGRSLVLRYRIE